MQPLSCPLGSCVAKAAKASLRRNQVGLIRASQKGPEEGPRRHDARGDKHATPPSAAQRHRSAAVAFRMLRRGFFLLGVDSLHGIASPSTLPLLMVLRIHLDFARICLPFSRRLACNPNRAPPSLANSSHFWFATVLGLWVHGFNRPLHCQDPWAAHLVQ